MNHSIMITIDGYSFQAVAVTALIKRTRTVTTIAAADIPTRVLGALSDHVVTVHDVLEIVRCHLNDDVHRFTCNVGSIEISWAPFDLPALRADLSGQSFRIKVTDGAGKRQLFDIGARDSIEAWHAIRAHITGGVRSSVIIPHKQESIA